MHFELRELAVEYWQVCPRLSIEIIRAKGLERINLEDLVEELLPRGRSLVPTQVKEDLLGQIKVFLENDADYRRLSGFWLESELQKFKW